MLKSPFTIPKPLPGPICSREVTLFAALYLFPGFLSLHLLSNMYIYAYF